VSSATSIRSLHRVPDIIGRDAIDGTTTGVPSPEATSNPRVANAGSYTLIPNEEGYCPGDRVRINWHRVFQFGRSTKNMPKTKTEGTMATVTRVTAKFVWAVLDGANEPIRKASHNVSLQTPAVGAETVTIQFKGQPQRQVNRRTN
jgi:hypothetical protein